jgi:hypothetical protein
MEVPDAFWNIWIKEQMVVNDFVITVNTTATRVLGYNPTRYALIFGRNASANTVLIFWEQQTGVPASMITLPTADATSILTRDQIGDVICWPVWYYASAAMSNMGWLELSYNPARWSIYRKVMDEFISKFHTS